MSQIDSPVTENRLEEDREPSGSAPVFWGWRMVMAGTVTSMVSSGLGFYGHGVILDPLRDAFGWSKGEISLAVTLYFLTSGLAQLVIGQYIDRYGPRWIMTFGALTMGAGFVILGHITRLWQLYALYPIMSVGWCCSGLVPINTLITNWFVRRRGLAMSVTMTGLSMGGVFIVPFCAGIIFRWGLETALPAMGLLYIIFVVPMALGIIKARPADVNQVPDGRSFPAGDSDPGYSSPDAKYPVRRWNRLQAARTSAFWAIVFGFLLALCGQIAFLVHQISFLSIYLGAADAAYAVSITALASIVGRLALGSMIDRLNKRLVTIGCFFLQGLVLVLMAYYHHSAILYAGTLVFGLTMGNILMMQSLIIGDCFGVGSFGTVFGAAGLFSMAGAAVGPWMAGFLFDLTDSYSGVFLIFTAFSFLASVFIFFAKPPAPVSEDQA